MPKPYTPNRKGLLITAVLSTVASVALLIFRPVPPVGVYAAISLLYLAVLFFWQALFPKHLQRMRRKMEKTLGEGTDDPNEPARWVP
jgi:hypothetical protein